MIPYNYDNPAFAAQKDLLITDGTVTVSGTSYSVTGATVTITNELLESEAFELNQSLNSASQLTFGSCESSSVSFVIHDNIPTLKGKTIRVYLIPDSDASKMLQIGVYKVDEDKLSADRTKRQITAYDALYDILNADVAGWYNNLLPTANDSVTLGQMRFALTAYFGLTQETITLPNDNLVIKRTIEPETLSGADVIRAICELEGCFGQISNEGKFKYVVLSENLDAGLFPSDTLYPANDLYPQDVNHDVDPISRSHYIGTPSFEDWNSESITGLTIRTDDADVGVTVGTNENVYVITGNFLVYGYNATQLTTAANNALSNMRNRYYKPCTVNAVGNPLHEVGDGIRISTTYRGIVTYILERKLSGIQALRDTYSANGEQHYKEQLNSLASQFKQLSGKVTQIKADTDGIKTSVSDLSAREASHFTQTSNQIALKVSKDNLVGDLNDEMSGIDITSDSIHIGTTGKFSIDSTNFSIDETTGDVSISEGDFIGGHISGAIVDSQGVNGFCEMYNGLILAKPSTASSHYVRISGVEASSLSGDVGITISDGSARTIIDPYSFRTSSSYLSQNTLSLPSNGVIVIGSTWLTVSGGSLQVDGSSVLTSVPTTLPVSTIQNTSGSNRIIIDGSSSAYNIVLNGSVNIGNGSSNTIRIKGRDVKWQSVTIDGTSYVVLVEA